MSQFTTETSAIPEGHEGPIKTPKQLIWTIIAAFVVPIALIVLLVNFVAFGTKPAAGTGDSTGLGPEAVALRLQPVGSVEIRDESGPAVLRTGEQVVQAQCSACHSTGAAGAPKIGDNPAWTARIATGFDSLLHSALAGKGAMTPQGGGDFSDFEIARAVVYLANESGAKFDEPAAPAAAASAADAASAPN